MGSRVFAFRLLQLLIGLAFLAVLLLVNYLFEDMPPLLWLVLIIPTMGVYWVVILQLEKLDKKIKTKLND
jgi:hypothetical protein